MTWTLSCAGQRCTSIEAVFPYSGRWSADCVLDQAVDPITGFVEVVINGLVMSGTVAEEVGGDWADGRSVRVLGGRGGWSQELPPRGYHNDAGVKASTVLQGTAQEARPSPTEPSEVLVFDATLERSLGLDFVRDRGAAAAVFAQVVPGAVWWTDLTGSTFVASSRPTSEIDTGVDVQLLDVDPLEQWVELAGDPAAVTIGSILRFPERLTEPFEVGELAIVASNDRIRMRATRSSSQAGGRLAGELATFARAIRDERLPGLYRYRVVEMAGDRAKLQAVTKGRWPDIVPCSLGAGVSGGWSQLTQGSIVVVAFIDEDRALPMIVSYPPKGQSGHLPVIAVLNATTEVHLGDAEAFVARIGDKGDAGGLYAGDGVTSTLVYVPPGGGIPQGFLLSVSGTPAQATPGGNVPGVPLVAFVNENTEGSAKVKA